MDRQLDTAVRRRWIYYRQAARLMGQEKDGTQGKTSLAWFYHTREPEELNGLTKAFLGDPEARRDLCWDEELPKDLRGGAPEYGWVEAEPNADQLKAIQTALTQPISFIQGPPGTGKTKMILNLASCIAHQKNSDGSPKTVAMVSQNNAAIANIEESIKKYRNGTPAQKWVWERFAPLGNLEKRTKFTAPEADGYEMRRAAIEAMGFNNGSGKPVKGFTYPPLDELSAKQKIEYQLPDEEDPPGPVRKEPYITSAFLRRYPLITSTLHSLRTCFQDSDEPNFQYDYVIVDETSQAGVIAGLLAMSCARHLVLVGDEEQLSAFLGAREREAMNNRIDPEVVRKAGELYEIRDNENFLTICLDVFLGKDKNGRRTGGIAEGRGIKTLLREHYRCHPGIIGYCNERIYGGELLPSRPDVNENKNYGYDLSVKVPIKILWYEGDYYEPGAAGEIDVERRNRRQATIFMKEEWPKLVERFRQAIPKKLSVCILTPFKDQRDELMVRICTAIKKLSEQDRRLFGSVEEVSEEETKEEYSKTIPALTINKAQGEEYDIVYLLPVEDTPKIQKKWPWSQGRAIVNVAVSRARDELRLIVSSDLMSEQVRERLKARGELQYPFTRINVGKGEDDLYIQHLVDYVMDRVPPDGDFSEYPRQEQFGFHKSRLTSIFDEVSWVRAQKRDKRDEDKAQEETHPKISAPERCLEQALAEILCRYQKERNLDLELYCNVPIKDMQQDQKIPGESLDVSDNLTDYFFSRAHVDFVVCEKGGRILLAIEVDGGYHRSREKVQKRDKKKNEIFKELDAACYLKGNQGALEEGKPFAFLRLPTDGSTYWETKKLWEQGDAELREAADKEHCFPIEDLIDQQLKAADTKAYYFIPMSLTKTMGEWKKGKGYWEHFGAFLKSLKTSGAEEFQRQLAEGPDPLLYEVDEEDQSGATYERWRPTEKGVELGIVRGIRLDSAGKPYCCPFYSEITRALILDYAEVRWKNRRKRG